MNEMIIAFAAAAALAGAAHAHAPATPVIDPDKFDLICQQKSIRQAIAGPPRILHLNLATNQWCDGAPTSCTAFKELKATPDQIRLSFTLAQTPLGLEANEQWIDRSNGSIHEVERLGGQDHDRIEGLCEKRAYMSAAPSTAF